MEKTIFEQMGGTYERQSDYFIPCLVLPAEEELLIGIWGQRYRRHLKKNHRILYYNYLTAGTLNRHISEVDKRAKAMFEQFVKELAEKENVTEQLKVDNLMEWVRSMNNIRSRAAEIVNAEVIYI